MSKKINAFISKELKEAKEYIMDCLLLVQVIENNDLNDPKIENININLFNRLAPLRKLYAALLQKRFLDVFSDDLLSLTEACKYTGLSRKQMIEWLNEYCVPHAVVNSQLYVNKFDIDAVRAM